MWLIVPVIFHLTISFLFPFIYWPEMFNYPFFLTSGWLPYKDWSMVYTPILPYILKFVYETFSYAPPVHHLFATLISAFSVLLVSFFVFKKTKNYPRSIVTGIFLSLFLLAFEGNALWFDIFLAPIIFLIFIFVNSKKFFLVGLLFGMAILTKQTSFYLLPPILFVILAESKISSIFSFSIPVIFLLVTFFIWLSANNLIFDFYKWGIKFVFLLPSLHDFSSPTIKQFLILIPFIVATILSVSKKNLFFLFFTVLFTFPRFGFFHLIPALVTTVPLIAIRRFYFLPILLLCALPLLYKNYFLGQRFLDEENLKTAKEVKENFSDKTIYSLNGPDLVYYLTGKIPAVKPWLDPLPWQMEYDKENFYATFAKNPPDIILTRPYLATSLDGLGAYRPGKITAFVQNNYQIVKIVGNVSFWALNR